MKQLTASLIKSPTGSIQLVVKEPDGKPFDRATMPDDISKTASDWAVDKVVWFNNNLPNAIVTLRN